MMYFLSLSVLIFVALGSGFSITIENEIRLLNKAIFALSKGLQFMQDQVSEINLDGAFGCRLVEELFDSMLKSNPDALYKLELYNTIQNISAIAGRVAQISPHYLKITEPGYYEDLGRLLEKSNTLMWYPGRLTVPALAVHPVLCSESVFNETQSDECLTGILGKSPDRSDVCNINKECLEKMVKPGQRGYMITHQVLYFQLAEMHGCLRKSQLLQNIPRLLQDTLCTNVMRDAIEIADSNYPLNHQDLFMEQIGLCGMWGYQDFYKEEWLREIISWQKINGCYADRAPWHCTENLKEHNTRIKRQEKILENGCLSHKTTVALLALAANIRISIENISQNI